MLFAINVIIMYFLWFASQVGFVNALTFSSNGKTLIAGIGQEHKLGRWWRIKNAKNALCIIPLERRENTENGKEDLS